MVYDNLDYLFVLSAGIIILGLSIDLWTALLGMGFTVYGIIMFSIGVFVHLNPIRRESKVHTPSSKGTGL